MSKETEGNPEDHQLPKQPCRVLHDGLTARWYGTPWMNPPYSNPTPWVEKAARWAEEGGLVVGLLPAQTSESWFRKYIHGVAREVRFVARLQFEGAPTVFPKPNVVVIWDGPNERNGTHYVWWDLTNAERGLKGKRHHGG